MKDLEKKLFAKKETFVNFLSEQEKTSLWGDVFTNEIETLPMVNEFDAFVPFTHNCKNGLTASFGDTTDEDIRSTVDTTKTAVALPIGDKMLVYPLRYTAWSHVQERAGIAGRAISSLQDKARMKEMSADKRCEIFNDCLSLHQDKTKYLIRDGKVTALLSQEYKVMPVSGLMDALEKTSANLMSVAFKNAEITHEIVSIIYDVADDNIINNIKKVLNKQEDVEVYCRLTSSDVGLCAARLTPIIKCEGRIIPIGQTLSVEHKGNETMERFESNCEKFLAMYKNNAENIRRLMGIIIKNPRETFEKTVDKIGLKGFSNALKECAERIEAEHVGSCTAYDIYWYTIEMLYCHEETNKSNGKDVPLYTSLKNQEVASQILFFKESDF